MGVGGQNLRKIILFFALSTAVLVLFQATLAIRSQQLSCNMFNADMYSF